MYVPADANACDVSDPPSRYVPPVDAVWKPNPATVAPEGTSNTIAVAVDAEFDVAAHDTAFRAYEPPVSSVPAVAPGAVEYRAA